MRRHVPILLTLLTALVSCKKDDPNPQIVAEPTDSLSVADSFKTPESVLYDPTLDVYIVSNINGSPFDRDDNGFLSRVAPDGRVVELKWVDGASDSVRLNAPKGMAIRGDTLFVADIDTVRLFDRTTGSALGAWGVSGAAFLNDMTTGPDGTMYVTDTGLDAQFNAGNGGVYRFDAGGRASQVARVRGTGPNGIIADSSGVVVVMWSGDVGRFETASRRTSVLPRSAHPQLDGLVRLANGALIASVWHDSSLIRLNPGDTAWTKLAGSYESPADIGYDTRRNRVLIPLFQANRVEVRPLR